MQSLLTLLAFVVLTNLESANPAEILSKVADERLAQPSDAKAREFAGKMGRGEGKLKPGDTAPDFELKKLRGTGTVRLSGSKGVRPVALVFGSYT